MIEAIPPRLRAPALMLLGGAAIAGVVAATNGSKMLFFLGPVVIVIALGYYLLAGRDDDLGAMLRVQADERQHIRRLRIQAFVGRVTAVAAVGVLDPRGRAEATGPEGRASSWPRRRPRCPRRDASLRMRQSVFALCCGHGKNGRDAADG
jgi:hypothetical protein